ncbi:MAG TPA: hypothetical protein VHO67_18395, partial [Polyangia bacterium]|nr:hypothetical protein [Polyangia bacterium]
VMGGAGGGAAGAAGNPAGGGAGQAAGGAAGCLDPAAFAASFAIADSTFCAVALYTAPESIGFQAPTWGSHGGPLVVQKGAASGTAGASGSAVTLERWTPPAGTTGAMTVQTTSIPAALPGGAFLGAQAVDLPFFGWTAITWINAFPNTTGQFEMIANGAIATTYAVNGAFGVAALPAASSQGRLVYSGLSPLGTSAAAANGLYEADACSSPTPGLGSGTGCSASAAVATWGENSGPVVADSSGDVFAVMSFFSTSTQEGRGFSAASIARGAGPAAGAPLFTLAGFPGSLAALSPGTATPGVVVFQPFDSTTFDALDVVEQKFTTTGGSLAVMGTASTLLTVPSGQMAGLSFLVDGSQRLWVAIGGASSTTYVVLARR